MDYRKELDRIRIQYGKAQEKLDRAYDEGNTAAIQIWEANVSCLSRDMGKLEALCRRMS